MRRGRSVIRRSVLCLLLLVFTIAAMPAAAQETERVGLRLIAVNTEKEAASLQMQLQAGGAFENLAKKYSTAPSAAEGGWLGLFQIAGLRPEFQDALRGLVPGQVSPILKVNEEYLLLKLASEAETHAAFGCELAEQRKLDAAVSEFREALRINPQYAQAHYYLGAALFELDNGVDEALVELREAIRLNPENAEAHNTLGLALLEQGSVDEAMREYREVLRIDPQYAEAHYNLGNALDDQGRPEAAAAEYREAMRINPGLAQAHYNLGVALQQQGNVDEAIQEYRDALRINPNDALLHNNLGVAIGDQGKLDQAIEQYHEALRLNPALALAHYNLGECLRQKGDRDGAVREFRDFLNLAENNSELKMKVERVRSILAELER